MRGKISVGVAVVLLGLISLPRQGVCQRPQAGMAGLSQAQEPVGETKNAFVGCR
jgi:hypothetical protein